MSFSTGFTKVAFGGAILKTLSKAPAAMKNMAAQSVGAAKNVASKSVGAAKNVASKSVGAAKNVASKSVGAVKNLPGVTVEGLGKVKGHLSGAGSSLKNKIEDVATNVEHDFTKGFNKAQGQAVPGAKKAKTLSYTDPRVQEAANKKIEEENARRIGAGKPKMSGQEATELSESTAREWEPKITQEQGKLEIKKQRAKRKADAAKKVPFAVKHPVIAGGSAAVLAHMALGGGGGDEQRQQQPPVAYGGQYY